MRDSYSAQVIVLLCLLALSGPVQGLSAPAYQTLCQEAGRCDLLAYCTVQPPIPKGEQGSKEVIVANVIKPHWLVGGAKVIRLDRELPVEDRRHPPSYLLYCEVRQGKVELSKAVRASAAIGPYLKGLLAIDDKDQPRRLRYCFSYLEHEDPAIALDAYYELQECPRRQLCRAARTFPAARVRRLVKAAATPAYRLPFYSLLLGCCGQEEDAQLLRKLIDRYVGENTSGSFEEMLAGYTLLRPKDGRTLAHSLLKRPLQPFPVRYAVLRMAIFFCENRHDAMSREQAVGLVRATLDHEDMTDLGIERLRRWRCWNASEDVFAVTPRTPVSRRALLRYALQCPGRRAADYVTKMRASDPETVEDAEELLKREAGEQVPPH